MYFDQNSAEEGLIQEVFQLSILRVFIVKKLIIFFPIFIAVSFAVFFCSARKAVKSPQFL